MHLYPIMKWISTILVLVTTICYLYQVVYLILPLIMKRKPLNGNKPTRYAILIAARNEEPVISHLLDSINAQDYPKELITTYVVADNCTDNTAKVAEEHGARVFQRFNKQQVGKGYAISYLIEQIRTQVGLEHYDAFLIFDADNLLEKDYVRQINKVCSSGYEAFCGYRNTKNYGSNWLSASYGLWYLHDSTHLNQSRMLLGTSCAVNGTGFGFTTKLLEKVGGWNFFTLTEDIEFATWCATHGIVVGYSHDAILYDEQPTSFKVSTRQRTRWVQGGIQVSCRYSKDLLKGLLRGGRTSYASFETATLSMWGYGMSSLTFCTVLAVAFLSERWGGVALTFGWAILGSYCSMFLMGALTAATEWKRIHATTAQKILSLFAFPIFMMTYAPITLMAFFKKFEWTPVPHTVAISTAELHQ